MSKSSVINHKEKRINAISKKANVMMLCILSVFALLCVLPVLLVVDILITSMAVAGRYIPFIPDPAWSEEVVLTCMSYMAVLSAALAIRRGAHIRMTAFDRYLPCL